MIGSEWKVCVGADLERLKVISLKGRTWQKSLQSLEVTEINNLANPFVRSVNNYSKCLRSLSGRLF